MGNDHMYYLVALAVGIAALFAVISEFRGQDLRQSNKELATCNQNLEWYRGHLGVGGPEG